MNYETTTKTTAARGTVWAGLETVTTLPKWTKSLTSVTPLDGVHNRDELAVGNRFRIKQPGFATVVWRVTEVTRNESFTWEAQAAGVHTVAYHRLADNPDGSTQITIGIRQSGLLAGLVYLLTATRTRRYLEMEAAGIKAAAETDID